MQLPDQIGGFTPDCVLIGDGQRADLVWTKWQFAALCRFMLNGDPTGPFLMAYREDNQKPRYVRARNTKVGSRIDWSWNAMTGRSARKTSVGFYPSNHERKSRWGALDFDDHDGNRIRPRNLAIAALELLR